MIVNATIAEALKEYLNLAPGGTFSQDFKAKRVKVPAVDPEKLGKALSVLVVARPDARQLLDRGGRQVRDILIDIGVQKKLTAGTDPLSEDANPEVDALETLTEEIADYLKPGVEFDGAAIVATSVTHVPEHLKTHSVYTGAITVTIKTVA